MQGFHRGVEIVTIYPKVAFLATIVEIFMNLSTFMDAYADSDVIVGSLVTFGPDFISSKGSEQAQDVSIDNHLCDIKIKPFSSFRTQFDLM